MSFFSHSHTHMEHADFILELLFLFGWESQLIDDLDSDLSMSPPVMTSVDDTKLSATQNIIGVNLEYLANIYTG